jgi:hypothetical protein
MAASASAEDFRKGKDMSVPHIDSLISVTTVLHQLPTLQPYSGERSFAFVNPTLVSALEPETINVGEETLSSKAINGTRVVTQNEIYFVPLTLTDVADKLQIELIGLEQEANA